MNPPDNVPLLTLSCREASRLISESLDRQLSTRERWALRIHLAICSACRQFARQIKLLRDALTNAPDALRAEWADGAAKLSAQRRAQIKRLIADAQEAEGLD
ncbi:MAG TPA: zf-HC2 domain-containing protein [Lacipirellulaceae bacterium]|nr:zf-HC2 domain-containing protein [Lacipirellulaceae bacterium]